MTFFYELCTAVYIIIMSINVVDGRMNEYRTASFALAAHTRSRGWEFYKSKNFSLRAYNMYVQDEICVPASVQTYATSHGCVHVRMRRERFCEKLKAERRKLGVLEGVGRWRGAASATIRVPGTRKLRALGRHRVGVRTPMAHFHVDHLPL